MTQVQGSLDMVQIIGIDDEWLQLPLFISLHADNISLRSFDFQFHWGLRAIHDEVALLVEILNALNDGGVVRSLHHGVETIQNVDVPFEEDSRVKMTEDIGGDYYWQLFVAIFQKTLELFFEVMSIGSKAGIEKSMSFVRLFLRFRPPSLLKGQIFNH